MIFELSLGFRSSLRNRASEQTNWPNAVREAALAHTLNDKIDAAFDRADFFEKRRELMDTWAKY